jgi:hypothetical protein
MQQNNNDVLNYNVSILLFAANLRRLASSIPLWLNQGNQPKIEKPHETSQPGPLRPMVVIQYIPKAIGNM